MYNQTRESRDLEHVSSETGPSIREELGLMEVSLDTLDIVTGGRDQGDRGASEGSVETEEGDTVRRVTLPDLLDKNGVKEDENMATVCEMYSESSSSGYCDNSEPEELDMEAEEPEETLGVSEEQTETPAQTQTRHNSRHQTLFSQMFALLNSELNS